MKNTLLFIYGTNILVRLLTVNMKNCLTPKNPKMCDPMLVTLSKMRPHYSQTSREKATPSSGTSPLTSYEKVLPPPTPGCLGAFGCRLRVWSKWETTCRFLPALSEVLNADFGQRTKDIWKLRDISISPFIPLRKGGENLGFSWNSTSGPLFVSRDYPVPDTSMPVSTSAASYDKRRWTCNLRAVWRFWSGAQASQGGRVLWVPPRGDMKLWWGTA